LNFVEVGISARKDHGISIVLIPRLHQQAGIINPGGTSGHSRLGGILRTEDVVFTPENVTVLVSPSG
jgi:hypothetical protein